MQPHKREIDRARERSREREREAKERRKKRRRRNHLAGDNTGLGIAGRSVTAKGQDDPGH